MAQETGRVEKIEDGWMEVKIPHGDGCAMCGSKTSCRFEGPDSAYRRLKVAYQPWISEGDRVTLEVPEASRNISVLAVFVLPIVLIVGGILLATNLLSGPYRELIGIGAGILAYVVSLVLVNRWMAHSERFTIKVVAVDKTFNEPGSEIESEDNVEYHQQSKM